jgi:predicted ABC-type ATPase
VRQGGHHVPQADVLRRFHRSWENFRHTYRPLADG